MSLENDVIKPVEEVKKVEEIKIIPQVEPVEKIKPVKKRETKNILKKPISKKIKTPENNDMLYWGAGLFGLVLILV